MEPRPEDCSDDAAREVAMEEVAVAPSQAVATSSIEEVTLSDLPDELQGRILLFLRAAELGRAICTHKWRAMAQVCAEQAACASVSAQYRACAAQPGASGACWLHVMWTCEELEQRAGRPPARSWRDEWVPLQLESLRLRAVKAGPEAEARLNALLTPAAVAEISKEVRQSGCSNPRPADCRLGWLRLAHSGTAPRGSGCRAARATSSARCATSRRRSTGRWRTAGNGLAPRRTR